MAHFPTFWTGITGVSLFILTCVLGGWQFDDYSHIAQYISETYATGTPHGPLLRFLGFIPSGLLLALFAWGAHRLLPPSGAARAGFLGLGLCYGLGTVVCSLFPCDPGCGRLSPSNASPSQLIHNLAGLLTYLTVPLALIALGVAARKWPGGRFVSLAGIVCGVTAVVGALLFLGDPTSTVAGLIQRLTESAILAWIVICAAYLRGRSTGTG
jgi:Protein of unknown function (DUF998)